MALAKLMVLHYPLLVAEAQAMASLTHPNLVAVYDVGKTAAGVYMTMQLLHAGTLRSWLGRSRPSLASILAAFLQAGDALMAAHERNIVHRDFKPDNILLTTDGIIKVADFELAAVAPQRRQSKQSESANAHDSREDRGPWVDGGTPAYMAPEQLAGGIVDASADQFAFCVSLYEAVYGVHPFNAASPHELLSEIEAARFSRPIDGHCCPQWLMRIRKRGLNFHAHERWDNMQSLLTRTRERLAFRPGHGYPA